MDAPQVEVGRLYKHYKGGVYYVVAIAYSSEGKTKFDEPLVIYRDMNGHTWHRPAKEWDETVSYGHNIQSIAGHDHDFGEIRGPRFRLWTPTG